MSTRLFTCVLALAAVACLSARPVLGDDDGFKSIFDGKTLKGWDGNPEFWSVEDGTLTGTTTKGHQVKANTFCIWTGGQTGDFELKLQYKIVGGNSGIQYRSFHLSKDNKWRIGGYQADFEAGDTYSGILYGEAFRGILANRGQKTVLKRDDAGKFSVNVVGSLGDSKEIGSKIKKEDWNDYHIIAKGYHFQHFINGVQTIDCVDEDAKERRDSGVLALQLHAGFVMKVQFRNIRIKMLGKSAAKDARPGSSSASAAVTASSDKAKKKVVLIAGNRSHGFGAHDHKAGCYLFAKELEESGLPIECVVTYPGWPKDESIFDGADAIVIYADGGGGHPMNAHLKKLKVMLDKGVGFGCIHYGVEVPKGPSGDAMLEWTGGYFETYWSVNPDWVIHNPTLAKDHPITRGVKPYQINDEWYYHMRFRPNMKGVTPILAALPPDNTMRGWKPGAAPQTHGGNPDVYKAVVEDKQPQVLMWARQRPESEGGGRGFGFTGGHYHWNWANHSQRTLILNGIAWIAHVQVPQGGVPSSTPTVDEMLANHDDAPPADKINRADIQKRLNALAGAE